MTHQFILKDNTSMILNIDDDDDDDDDVVVMVGQGKMIKNNN